MVILFRLTCINRQGGRPNTLRLFLPPDLPETRAGAGRNVLDYTSAQYASQALRSERSLFLWERHLPTYVSHAHNLEEMFANVTWFLKAAVPAAEKAGVRLALHPNDPPAPISRGSQQIMGSLAGWKRLIDIVKSPANGITYDSGVTREMGEDPVAVAEYFASRKQINHVHYRNVQVVKPYEKYQEVFIDAGQGDMFGVMKALVRNKYTGTIYPEHPRALDTDRDRVAPGGRLGGYPGGGGPTGITYSVAYTRAMMQAALESV